MAFSTASASLGQEEGQGEVAQPGGNCCPKPFFVKQHQTRDNLSKLMRE